MPLPSPRGLREKISVRVRGLLQWRWWALPAPLGMRGLRAAPPSTSADLDRVPGASGRGRAVREPGPGASSAPLRRVADGRIGVWAGSLDRTRRARWSPPALAGAPRSTATTAQSWAGTGKLEASIPESNRCTQHLQSACVNHSATPPRWCRATCFPQPAARGHARRGAGEGGLGPGHGRSHMCLRRWGPSGSEVLLGKLRPQFLVRPPQSARAFAPAAVALPGRGAPDLSSWTAQRKPFRRDVGGA